MELPHREVLICDDAGGVAYAKAAPLLLEALQLIAATQTVRAAAQLAHHIHEVACDSTPPTFTQHSALDELFAQQTLLQPYMATIDQCFGPVFETNTSTCAHRHGDLLCSSDGLLLPHGVALPKLRRCFMCFDYATFHDRFTRLSAIAANGLLFTACEPRLRVLQSRYALHRAYNGSLEDDSVQGMSGVSGALSYSILGRAPRLDLRRLETCMTADALVHFMEQIRHTQGALVQHKNATTSHGATVRGSALHKCDGCSIRHGGGAEELRVRDAIQRFTAATQVPLSAEALCLRPNYADTAAKHWLDLRQLAERGGPRGALAQDLLHHFLSINNGNHGDLLARLVVTSLTHPTTLTCSTPTSALQPCYDALELEFTVTGRTSGELETLATWCVEGGLLRRCPHLQFCIRVSQGAYDKTLCGDDAAADASTGAARTLQDARSLADVIHNIFAPLWQALLRPDNRSALVKLLPRIAAFSLVFDHTAELQEMPAELESAVRGYDPARGAPPPDALFAFLVWCQVQLVNCFVTAHARRTTSAAEGQHQEGVAPLHVRQVGDALLPGPLRLRLHGGCNSRSLFTEAILGLMLADDVVNPSAVFEWSPLGYLYYLAQRHVLLTPVRNRVSDASVATPLRGAVPYVVHTGLHASLATLDPLFYHASEDALTEEMQDVQKNHGLCPSDMAELCFASVEANALLTLQERRRLFGDAWPRARSWSNLMASTHVPSLRLRHRETAFLHEMRLLRRHVDGASGHAEFDLILTVFHAPRMSTSAALGSTAPPPSQLLSTDVGEDGETRGLATLLSNYGYHHYEPTMRFPRIVIAGPRSDQPDAAAKGLTRAMRRRQYYQQYVIHADAEAGVVQGPGTPTTAVEVLRNLPTPAGGDATVVPPHNAQAAVPAYSMVDGVFDVRTGTSLPALPTWQTFQHDVRWLRGLAHQTPLQRFASRRLGMLECKFSLHAALTHDDEEGFYVDLAPMLSTAEAKEKKTASACTARRLTYDRLRRGDLYTCVKVDVHCHMAGGMTARALLAFMKRKLQTNPDDIVDLDTATGKPVTLTSLMSRVLQQQQEQQGRYPALARADASNTTRLTDLTIGSLEVLAGNRTFNRFDEFNSRYSPMGASTLRTLFLKTDNFMGGRYFAELIRDVFASQQREGNTFSEYRLSIYGRHPREWDKLACWFVTHSMTHETNRWLIQVPRLFSLYRRGGLLRSFADMLHNIFGPLWDASVYPERHPFLNYLLAHVSGFDSVDNESDREPDEVIHTPPQAWTRATNPPYAYYMYYMWVNITSLNRYRAAKGLSTFDFRPHGGESGDPDHMADIFFVADGVGHGINLTKRPVLQYLYYLAHIPLAIVPLSNNALFCRYAENPFPLFFRRGLNVALATDGALMFHHTEQPLVEEYSTARNFWCLSDADVCELARNSVLMSGFPTAHKEQWLGKLYRLHSVAGNDPDRSHVPMTRCAFRYEAYLEEMAYVEARAAVSLGNRAMATPLEEELHILDTLGLTRQQVLLRRWKNLPVQSAVKCNHDVVDKHKTVATPSGFQVASSRL